MLTVHFFWLAIILLVGSLPIFSQVTAYADSSFHKEGKIRYKQLQTTKYLLEMMEWRVDELSPARIAPLENGYVLSVSLQNTTEMAVLNLKDKTVRKIGKLPIHRIADGKKWVWPRVLDIVTLSTEIAKGETAPHKAEFLISMSVFDGSVDKRCQFVFVQKMTLDLLGKQNHEIGETWFKSPCIPEKIGTNHSWESGGGLAVVPLELRADPAKLEFLFSMGHFHVPEGKWLNSIDEKQKKLITATVWINSRFNYKVVSTGHRNTQGIAFIKTGMLDIDILGTDHGPYSGDELNRIEFGADFGWPNVTFGMRYNSKDRFTPQVEGAHPQGTAPIYYWSEPGNAASPLIQITDKAFFGGWVYPSKYNLSTIIVGAMAKGALHRLVYDGERILSQETIDLGFRPRSLIQMDGMIIIGSDDGLIATIRPLKLRKKGQFIKVSDPTPTKKARKTEVVSTSEKWFSSASAKDGKTFFNRCRGCHSISKNTVVRGGPNLAGIGGRRIGTLERWKFSDALRLHNGIWSANNLDLFLKNPKKFAPGNKMSFFGIRDKKDRRDLIKFLFSLQK